MNYKKYLTLILMVCSLEIYGDTTQGLQVEGNLFNSSSNYFMSYLVDYELHKNEIYELKSNIKSTTYSDSNHMTLNFGADAFYNDVWSPFIFMSATIHDYDDDDDDDYKYAQTGVGFAFLADSLRNKEAFPFYHKLSLAYIKEYSEDDYLSFRYKFKFNKNNFSVSSTYFIYSHGYKLSSQFSYLINQHIYLKYNIFQEIRELNDSSIDYYSNDLKLGMKLTF